MNGLFLIIGIILIFLAVFIVMNYAYGQVTSPLKQYGAEMSLPKEDNKPLVTEDLNICAEYKDGCDIVPQNTPIPKEKIPYEGIKKGKMYI